MLVGTTVNALSVVLGALIGLTLKWAATSFATRAGKRAGLADALQDIVMKAVSLCVVYIGISGMLKGQNTLLAILSMVLGALVGELLDLDGKVHALGDLLQVKTAGIFGEKSNISEGFVTASLLFCVGAMAIVGALQDGLTGDHSTLFAKSLLDFISAIVFASSLGVGVLFSAGAIFLYQGSIALLAALLAPYLGDAVVAEMSCVGSMLILALGMNMLGVTKIKVMNLVPACILPVILSLF